MARRRRRGRCRFARLVARFGPEADLSAVRRALAKPCHRLEHRGTKSMRPGCHVDFPDLHSGSERPADVLQRNFWFCTLDDPSTIDTRHRIGIDHVMVEVDYPHGDGTWPDTQLEIEKYWGHIPDDELRMMCCENAAKLYRHPLPAVVLPR